MKFVRISFLVLVVAFVAVAVLGGTRVSGSLTAPRAARPYPPLSGGASSVDELLGKFVNALADNDRRALDDLRVGEEEYRERIMPGSVKPGDPPQKLSPAADQYFWESLNLKSLYSEQGLLNEYGGRAYTIKSVIWRKGIKDYDGFRCYDRLEMTMADADGNERVLSTGSVAEVDGTFKFISFIRD